MNLDELIPAYFRYTEELRRGVPPDTPEMDALDAAYRSVHEGVRRGSIEDAWSLTREILRRAPDEELRAYAVAILELFVSLRRAEAVPLIEREAVADERFKWALGCIYLDRDLPEELQLRLRRASGDVMSIPARR